MFNKILTLAMLVTLFVVGPVEKSRAAENPPVEQWGLFELTLPGPAAGNPFIDVTLTARFSSGNDTLTVSGFYDGNGAYRVRFSPPRPGEWQYATTSNVAALNAHNGSVIATPPTGDNHGPIRIIKTFHFAYADGTPYFQVGTTCYAWTHQPDALEEMTLKTLAASPFNKLRMCIFPKSYTYNTNDPPNYPIARGADGKFDTSQFDPANWQHLEKRILDLQKLGIQADLILFHPYDRWGFATMDKTADDRYLRYAIARLSAFRNVWWSLANEYDFMIPPLRAGQKGNKSIEDFDRFFSILQNEDAFDRFRGIHYASKMYDNTKAWVTHASIQTRDLTQILAWREKFQKPIVIDECRYEGNIPNSWGNLTAPEMVSQFWTGTICGGYVGHGETLKDPDDILWWSKGGVLHGESPARITFLKKIMEALPYTEMTPARLDANTLMLAKPGEACLIYALKPGVIKVTLPGDKDYTVEAIDTWNMKTETLAPAQPGLWETAVPAAHYLLRLTVK